MNPADQVAPSSIDAEKSILGAVLLDNDDFSHVLPLLPGDFSLDSHKRIVRAMRALNKRDVGIDIVTLGEELNRTGETEMIGGYAYLASLTEGLPRRPKVEQYVAIVQDKGRARRLIGSCYAAAARAYGQTEDALEIAADLAREAEQILELPADDGAAAEISATVVKTMDRFNTKRKLTESPGLSFGLPFLDKETGGMQPGQQTAVGCLPGVGKTNFMAQAIYKTLKSGHRVEAFLLEPTRDEITLRLTSLMVGCPYKQVLWPWTCPEETANQLLNAAGELADMPLRMHDKRNLDLDDVLRIGRYAIEKRGARLLCLDYIQRLKVRSESREEAPRLKMGRISMGLADLVKNTNCHSLLLSQLNTGRKSTAGTLPTMFDFSEAAQIERDAHTIILLHREYGEKEGHYLDKGAILVPKQRFGSPCNLKAWLDPVSATWTDMEPGQQTFGKNWGG